jgi:hypothetical protein
VSIDSIEKATTVAAGMTTATTSTTTLPSRATHAPRSDITARPPRQATPERRPPPSMYRGRTAKFPCIPTGGRRWHLLSGPTGVTATTATGPVAGAQVSERDDEVLVDFWADTLDAPGSLRAHLVEQVFAHPALRMHRPVVVCVPRGDITVIAEARRHLSGARTWVAGATCLIRGDVRDDGPLPL